MTRWLSLPSFAPGLNPGALHWPQQLLLICGPLPPLFVLVRKQCVQPAQFFHYAELSPCRGGCCGGLCQKLLRSRGTRHLHSIPLLGFAVPNYSVKAVWKEWACLSKSHAGFYYKSCVFLDTPSSWFWHIFQIPLWGMIWVPPASSF